MLIQRMRDWMSRRVRDERGFTLVELLMVMVIIGVLAGLGFTGYNALQTRAAVTQADVYWRDLNTAVTMYRVSGGAFAEDELNGSQGEPEGPIRYLHEFLDLDVEPWVSVTWTGTQGGDTEVWNGVAYEIRKRTTANERDIVCVWVNGHASNQNDDDKCGAPDSPSDGTGD